MSYLLTLDEPGQVVDGVPFEGDPQNEQLGGILVKAPGCRISNCIFTGMAGLAIGIVDGCDHTVIEGCDFDSNWKYSVAFTGRDSDYTGSRVSRCRFAKSGLGAIQICGNGIKVVDNDIGESPYAGIYAATGTRNAIVARNVIADNYAGIDVSWTISGGNRAGTDLTGGVVIEGNRVIRCNNGIGTASNGTIIYSNIVTDAGQGHQQTYTLLGATFAVMSPGSGYAVGDVLKFSGGVSLDGYEPGKVIVTLVDTNGGIVSCSHWYDGVYFIAPDNPNTMDGGNGSGAVVSVSRWNMRSYQSVGIVIGDACNCAVSGNISGNTGANRAVWTQRVGFMLKKIFTQPINNLVTGNVFLRNLDFPVAGYYGNGYAPAVLAGNTILNNVP